jgi:hypothetical protein
MLEENVNVLLVSNTSARSICICAVYTAAVEFLYCVSSHALKYFDFVIISLARNSQPNFLIDHEPASVPDYANLTTVPDTPIPRGTRNTYLSLGVPK